MSLLLQKKKHLKMCEYIHKRLYFATLKYVPKSLTRYYFFSTDNEFVYEGFHSDFGPLNLGLLYKYCTKLDTKLKDPSLSSKLIVHYTSFNPQKRANAAFLIASYAVLYLKMTPKQAILPLLAEGIQFLDFQDAIVGKSQYTISLLDCVNGVYRAHLHRFFRFTDFDLEEYEHYSNFHNGNLNWIVPQKFLAFSDPIDGKSFKKHETYINYFSFNNVTTIIRLNKKTYDAYRFVRAGFKHYDLYMHDGSAPTLAVLKDFLYITEQTDGAIAVHCKAGLGRTGSLIGAYLVKHYQMSAKEAIAWLRICRPGSVIGYQQSWLESQQIRLQIAGDRFRLRNYTNKDYYPYHTFGIYSIKSKQISLYQYDALLNINEGKCPAYSPVRSTIASGCFLVKNPFLQGLPTVVKSEYRKYGQKPRRQADLHKDGESSNTALENHSMNLNNSIAKKKRWRKICIHQPATMQRKENKAAHKNESQGQRLLAIKALQGQK